MRRPIKLSLLVVATLALLGALLLWSTVRRGFSTHDEPSRMEASVARTVRHWSVPADLRDARNPLPLTPQVLGEARAHWADHCATCHGNDGKGKTAIGENLYPRAPDMTLPATQELSDGELFAIIENGIRLTGMPGWGNGTAESAYGSWGLVHLIRHLAVPLTEDDKRAVKVRIGIAPAANTALAVDPVCGMKVDPKTASRSVHAGKTYYFCSKEEKAKFDKNPGAYLKKGS